MILPDDRDVDLDDEDGRTDISTCPQDAQLEDGGRGLDDMAPPQHDTVYGADAAHDVRM